MKVNELKALYQKKHIIIAQPQNPPIHNKIHTQPITQPISKPEQITERIITQQAPIMTIQKEVTLESSRKNSNFLTELNKKLETKSRQSQLQQNFHYYSRGQTDLKAQPISKQESNIQLQHLIEKPQQNIRQKSKTFDVGQEQQLDFSKIIGNENEGLIKSRIRARFAVDQRHPITNQDKILFTELDTQNRETIETNKLQTQNKLRSGQENHNSVSKQDIAKSMIESTKIEEKINRIDYFLACIFGEKERQFVGQKSMQVIGTNIVDLFNQKMKTFKKHPINSEVTCRTTQPLLKTLPSSVTPIIKQSESSLDPNTTIPQQKIIEQTKKQITLPIQGQTIRPNLSMTKQLLQEMNMKLKQTNNLLKSNNANTRLENTVFERSVSPISKKKRHLEKFDDV